VYNTPKGVGLSPACHLSTRGATYETEQQQATKQNKQTNKKGKGKKNECEISVK